MQRLILQLPLLLLLAFLLPSFIGTVMPPETGTLEELTSSLPGVNQSICGNEQSTYTFICGSNRTYEDQMSLQWYFNGKRLNGMPFVTGDPVNDTNYSIYPVSGYHIFPVLISNSTENGTRFESLLTVRPINENQQPFNVTCEINGIDNYTTHHKIESDPQGDSPIDLQCKYYIHGNSIVTEATWKLPNASNMKPVFFPTTFSSNNTIQENITYDIRVNCAFDTTDVIQSVPAVFTINNDAAEHTTSVTVVAENKCGQRSRPITKTCEMDSANSATKVTQQVIAGITGVMVGTIINFVW